MREMAPRRPFACFEGKGIDADTAVVLSLILASMYQPRDTTGRILDIGTNDM